MATEFWRIPKEFHSHPSGVSGRNSWIIYGADDFVSWAEFLFDWPFYILKIVVRMYIYCICILYLSTISSKYSKSFLLNLIFLVKSKRNAYSAPQLWNSIWGDNQNNLCSTEGNPDWQHAFIFIWREMLNSTKRLLNATA